MPMKHPSHFKEQGPSKTSLAKKTASKKQLHLHTGLARQHQQQQEQEEREAETTAAAAVESAAATSASSRVNDEQPSSAEVEQLTSMMGSIHNNNNTFMAITKESLSQHNNKTAEGAKVREIKIRRGKQGQPKIPFTDQGGRRRRSVFVRV